MSILSIIEISKKFANDIDTEGKFKGCFSRADYRLDIALCLSRDSFI